MSVIETYPMSAVELMEKLGLKSRVTFRKNYIQPALEAGLIAMTDPDTPTNRNQRYFKVWLELFKSLDMKAKQRRNSLLTIE